MLRKFFLLLALLFACGDVTAAGWDGSGHYYRARDWTTDELNNIKPSATRFDEEDDTFAAGLNNVLTKDGQNMPTGNLPMGGFRHTGVANGTARDNYAAIGQVQDGTTTYAADTGSANAYVITLLPAISTYTGGQTFFVKIGNTNTTSSTLNVNGVGAKSIKKNVTDDVSAGDLVAGGVYTFIYDGTNFQVSVVPSTISTTLVTATNVTAGTLSASVVKVNTLAAASASISVSGTLSSQGISTTGIISTTGLYAAGDISATGRVFAGSVSASTVSSTVGYFNQVSATTGIAFGQYASTSDTAISSGMTLTLTHGFGAIPKFSWVEIVNTSTELGYSVGDVVQVPPYAYQGSNLGYSTRCSVTSCILYVGTAVNPFSIISTSGANSSITNAKWNIRVKAVY